MKVRQLLRACAALALIAHSAPAAAQSNSYAVTQARTLFEQLRDDARCETALPSAREFWPSAEFRTLPPLLQEGFLAATAYCATTLHDGAAAIAAVDAARGLGAKWTGAARLELGVAFNNHAVASAGFFEFAEQDPQAFAGMALRAVSGALRAAREVDPSGATALRMYDALERANYADPEGAPDSALRVAHARLLIESNQASRARGRLAGITDPRLVLAMRVDRTFDGLRADAAFERQLDLIAAAEADLRESQAKAEAEPRRLSHLTRLSDALRALGRDEEALALIDRHLAVAQGPDGAAQYDDHAENLNWLLNERGYVLYALNRPDEAREAFGAAIASGESGQWNVSQVINFASMLVAEGRAADALQVVSVVGRASPYGDMWVANVKVCANDQLGNVAARDEALAFMRDNADDNIAALSGAYLCLNDLDAAAALYIRRLGDAQMREQALLALQTYRARPTPALPFTVVLRARLEEVKARPDVRAAIEAVSRVEDVPLHAVYWGDV